MVRTTATALAAVVALGVAAAPASAAKPTLGSIAKRLQRLEKRYTDVQKELAKQTQLNASLKNCLERTYIGEGGRFLINTDTVPPNPLIASGFGFGLFFPRLEQPASQPFANANFRFWSVGVKNTAQCLKFVPSFREPHPGFPASARGTQKVASGGK